MFGKLKNTLLFHFVADQIVVMHQGPESLSTITAVDNLATTLQASRKLDEAEELFQRLVYYVHEIVTISFTCALVSCLDFVQVFSGRFWNIPIPFS